MADTGPEHDFLTAAPQLLEAARGGSVEALGQLMDHCRRYLLAVARRELPEELRSKASPSDLVQDSLTEGVRQFVQFNGSTADDLRVWLTAILYNKLGNFRQSYGRAKRWWGRELPLSGQLDPESPEIDLADHLPSPSSIVTRREQAALLQQALERLPEAYRLVVRWRNWERLSFVEIGRRLDRTEDAARMIWARAIDRLGQELALPPPPTDKGP